MFESNILPSDLLQKMIIREHYNDKTHVLRVNCMVQLQDHEKCIGSTECEQNI